MTTTREYTRGPLDGSRFRDLIQHIADGPPVEILEVNKETLGIVNQLLDAGFVLKIPQKLANASMNVLIRSGATRIAQYESVRDGLANPTEFTALARVTSRKAETSATKAASTRPHIDGYQFWHLYRGTRIGGIGYMPDVEVLAYPVLYESRDLVFYDNCAAGRELLAEKGEEVLAALAETEFSVQDKYRREDPELQDPGRIPFLYREGRTVRFHVGGSVYGLTPSAQNSLELFNLFLAKTAIVIPVQEGFTYMTNPTRAAHAGLRWPGVDGETRLDRLFLRYERPSDAGHSNTISRGIS